MLSVIFSFAGVVNNSLDGRLKQRWGERSGLCFVFVNTRGVITKNGSPGYNRHP